MVTCKFMVKKTNLQRTDQFTNCRDAWAPQHSMEKFLLLKSTLPVGQMLLNPTCLRSTHLRLADELKVFCPEVDSERY